MSSGADADADATAAASRARMCGDVYRSLERDVDAYERRAREDIASLVALAVVERVIIDDDDDGGDADGDGDAGAPSTSARDGATHAATTPALARAGSRELMDLLPKARAAPTSRATPTSRASRSTWAVNALHKQFNTAIGAILDELVKLDVVDPFLIAVDVKNVPDYYVVIEAPIDIATMREKARSGQYLSKDAFVSDLRLMESNAVAYNGSKSVVAEMARAVVGRGEELLAHVPRVDFATCARVAAFAEALTRGNGGRDARGDCVRGTRDLITDVGYGDDEEEEGEEEEEDDDEKRSKPTAATIRTRVRRVFRAKALAGLPLGNRRAVRPRSARGMLEFMRASVDHEQYERDMDDDIRCGASASIEIGASSAAPEDEIFVANAVPVLPQYAGTALVMHDHDVLDAMTRAVASAWLERPQFAAEAGVAGGALSIVASRAHDFITDLSRAVKRATMSDRKHGADADAGDVNSTKKKRTRLTGDAQLSAAIRVSRQLPHVRRALGRRLDVATP